MRRAVGWWPEFFAVAGLMAGYLLGSAFGSVVVGALVGGTLGLGVALWGSDVS